MMDPVGKQILAMLVELVTSKKFLVAVLTAILTLVIKDTATRDRVLGIGVTLIAGIAVTDHGKAAAEIAAANPAPAAAPSTATTNVNVSTPPAPPAP